MFLTIQISVSCMWNCSCSDFLQNTLQILGSCLFCTPTYNRLTPGAFQVSLIAQLEFISLTLVNTSFILKLAGIFYIQSEYQMGIMCTF